MVHVLYACCSLFPGAAGGSTGCAVVQKINNVAQSALLLVRPLCNHATNVPQHKPHRWPISRGRNLTRTLITIAQSLLCQKIPWKYFLRSLRLGTCFFTNPENAHYLRRPGASHAHLMAFGNPMRHATVSILMVMRMGNATRHTTWQCPPSVHLSRTPSSLSTHGASLESLVVKKVSRL